MDDCSLEEALTLTNGWLRSDRSRVIITPNPEILLHSYRHKKYQSILKLADLSIADGYGLRLASKIKHTVPGVDFASELLKLSGNLRITAVIRRDGKSNATQVSQAIQALAPGAIVSVIASSQEWSKRGGRDLAESVSHTDPDLVLVGLGFPYQEEWSLTYNDIIPTARLFLTLGGTFDFWTGAANRAPAIIRQLHLEWLWRLIKEPRRYRRIFRAIIVFPLTVLLSNKS